MRDEPESEESEMPKSRQPRGMTFGRALRWMREEMRLTQGQLAERLKVSQASLSRWEADEAVPPVTILAEISIALNAPVSTFLSLLGIEPQEHETIEDWAERVSQQVLEEERRQRAERLQELEDLRKRSREERNKKGMTYVRTNANNAVLV